MKKKLKSNRDRNFFENHSWTARGGKIFSDRLFGIIFAIILFTIGIVKHIAILYKSIICGIAFSLILISFIFPKMLHPLNYLWMQFGELLHRAMAFVIMIIIFFGIFTPFGIIIRLFGRDLLNLKFDKTLKSYWVKKDPSNVGTLYNQF